MLVCEEASVGVAGVAGRGWGSFVDLKICEQSALATRGIHSQTSIQARVMTIRAVSFSLSACSASHSPSC
jgi:hypothetical protein